MSVSVKAAIREAVSDLAIAAVIAALLCTPGATQAVGGAMAMPANCQQNPAKCSMGVWSRDSFPHRGSQESITFSNGAKLACTSNGKDVPRSCTLTGDIDATRPQACPSERLKLQQDTQTQIFSVQQDVQQNRSAPGKSSQPNCDEYIRQ